MQSHDSLTKSNGEEDDSFATFVEVADVEEDTEGSDEAAVKRVSVAGLRTCVLTEYEKAAMCSKVPMVILWLTALTVVSILSGAASSASYNVLFHLENAHHEELSIADFHSVSTPVQMWKWVRSTVKHLWLRDIAPQNYPLGYFLLRQYRVGTEGFDVPNMISPDFFSRLPEKVAKEWGDGDVSDTAYGPSKMYIPNSMQADPISVLSVTTDFNTYSNPNDAFAVPLNLLTPLSDVLDTVDTLETTEWVDNATRVVCFDILTYNPSVGSFAGNHMYIEFFASGSSAVASKAYPFKILHLDSHFNRFILAVDCAVIAGTAALLFSMFATIYTNRDLGEQWVSAWELYDLAMIGFLITAYTYRMSLWGEGPSLVHGNSVSSAGNPNLEMYSELFHYGYLYERSNTFLAVSVTMGWLRFLRVLQHTTRLGVLSSTIRHAAGELFSLMVIYLVVLTGYSLGATMLFGADFKEMSTVRNSFGYLTRLTISAEIGADWTRLGEIHPEWVWLFMGSFMVLCWLILLNMVLAIVSGSFASVQNAMGGTVASWSYRSISQDIKKTYKNLGKKSSGGGSTQANRKAAIRILSSYTRTHPMGDKASVTSTEWLSLVNGVFCEKTAAHIYNKAGRRSEVGDIILPVVPKTPTDITTHHVMDEEVTSRLINVETELSAIKTILLMQRDDAGKPSPPCTLILCEVCGVPSSLPFCAVTGKLHGYVEPPTVEKATPLLPPPRHPFSRPFSDRRTIVTAKPKKAKSTGFAGHSYVDESSGSLQSAEPSSPVAGYVRTVT